MHVHTHTFKKNKKNELFLFFLCWSLSYFFALHLHYINT